jgi:hypothetical protein
MQLTITYCQNQVLAMLAGTAHVEVARSNEAENIRYCSKAGDVRFSTGLREKITGAERKEQWAAIREDAKTL